KLIPRSTAWRKIGPAASWFLGHCPIQGSPFALSATLIMAADQGEQHRRLGRRRCAWTSGRGDLRLCRLRDSFGKPLPSEGPEVTTHSNESIEPGQQLV